jgi:DNA-directed RNA polymerase subunit beta'
MEELSQLSDFASLRISVASPDKITSWSHGEVTKPETINYRTFRPEKDGLFDERIFGPTKDYECYCGKYKRIRYKGVVCDKCGVEVTRKRVRRERMGHLKLAAPVAHAWYFRGVPSKLGLLLDISPRLLENVIYFSRYMVIEVNYPEKAKVIANLGRELDELLEGLKTEFNQKEAFEQEEVDKQMGASEIKDKEQLELAKEELQLRFRKKSTLLNERYLHERAELENSYKTVIDSLEKIEEREILAEDDYLKVYEHIEKFAKVGMGAEAVREVLAKMNLEEMSATLKKSVDESSGQKEVKLVKRLAVVESLRRGNVRPEWMILTNLPIIPPDLRPMVQLEGGRFATSDLNDLYRAVINRNNRLKRLLDLGAPDIIVRNEKRMLQESVDALVDSGKVQRYRVRRGKQALKSLTDMLKGKQGRFRQNLLGKRVDYSGRSVIVAGPSLKLEETGIPKEMALELFKPFVIRELLLEGHAPNPKSAKYFLEGRTREVWDALEKVVHRYPVLLNRAPTLHRLGVVAFYPRLIEGNAIQLHPCVCSGFNADFDGDMMAVHVPLSEPAKQEAENLMLATKNLIKPADGEPIAVPAREMVLGTYYLTSIDKSLEEYPNVLSSKEEAFMAMDRDLLSLRQPVRVLLSGEILATTVGRIIFNDVLPESLRFCNEVVEKKKVRELINDSLLTESEEVTVRLIDDIKDLGFKYATYSGVSVSIFDSVISPNRDKVMLEAEDKALEINNNFKRGLITRREKSSLLETLWIRTTNELDNLTWDELTEDNSVKFIISAGASRASRDQVKQLGGMKGMVMSLTGGVAELPIKSNFRIGLSGIEYFTGARAARKALADTALKTADSGYLTRRLVDVAQDAIIRSEDCGTAEGYEIHRKQKISLTSFSRRIFGRIIAQDVKDGRKVIVKNGEFITEDLAEKIANMEIESVKVRSPLTCEASFGVCQKCYGLDLGDREMVDVGTPVGVIAAQSIGEPGTQLTLRTFHTGGIVGKDITEGLPRITELFEVRTPKFKSVMSEIEGEVSVLDKNGEKTVTVTPVDKRYKEVDYKLPRSLEVLVKSGDFVRPGDRLTEGYLDPKVLLEKLGIEETQRYLIDEVQNVYSSQGVSLNDKHVEVIVRQMFSKRQVVDPGDTAMFPGDIVSTATIEEENGKTRAQKGKEAIVEVVILGITKAALKTDSFLAAASFQETSRVLTEAAMSGKVDHLLGLKGKCDYWSTHSCREKS